MQRLQARSLPTAELDFVHPESECVAASRCRDQVIAAHHDSAGGAGNERGGQDGQLLEELRDVGPVEQQMLQFAVGRRQLEIWRPALGIAAFGFEIHGGTPVSVPGVEGPLHVRREQLARRQAA